MEVTPVQPVAVVLVEVLFTSILEVYEDLELSVPMVVTEIIIALTPTLVLVEEVQEAVFPCIFPQKITNTVALSL